MTVLIRDLSFRTVCDAAVEGIVLAEAGGRFIYANRAACDIFRATQEELCEVGRAGVVDLSDSRWAPLVDQWSRTGQVTGVAPMKRLDGTEFLAAISASSFTGDLGDQLVCVMVRDVTRQTRAECRLRAFEEIAQALLRGAESSQVLELIARHACAILDASVSWIYSPAPTGEGMTIVAAHGIGAEELIGCTVPAGGLAESVIESGRGLLVERTTTPAGETEESQVLTGPGMIVPITTDHAPLGALCLGVRNSGGAYRDEDLKVATHYAAGAAVALQFDAARRDREKRLALTAEQLQQALDRRIVIEQAKGRVAAFRDVSMDEAFNLIRRYARSHNMTVQSAASLVVDRRLLI